MKIIFDACFVQECCFSGPGQFLATVQLPTQACSIDNLYSTSHPARGNQAFLPTPQLGKAPPPCMWEVWSKVLVYGVLRTLTEHSVLDTFVPGHYCGSPLCTRHTKQPSAAQRAALPEARPSQLPAATSQGTARPFQHNTLYLVYVILATVYVQLCSFITYLWPTPKTHPGDDISG